MKRSLISAILLSGLAVSANAADLSIDSVKDSIPAIPDGPITWNGVTFYGTVDVGYAYVDNGLKPSGAFYNGAAYTILGSPYSRGTVSALNNNALSPSNVGLKFDFDIGGGFKAIGKLQTQFNPISGELGDACESLLRTNGRPWYGITENFSDGSRCGQAFSDAAFGGISHPLYGTLTVGRQTTLVSDGLGVYDPIAGSPAFSLLGYSGTAGGGTGSTETSRWDNSLKYVLSYGPVHAAGMYTAGGQDTPTMDDSYGANVGVTYKGFSVDGFYTQTNGAVNLSRLGFAAGAATLTTCDAYLGNCPNYLLGTITDNEAWDVMAKYVFNVPSFFGAPVVSLKDAPCGGFKDAPCEVPQAKVSIMGGYQHVDQSNPDHPQSYYSGSTTQGGYQFITTGTYAFGSDRIRETAWAGVRYEDGPWTLAAAYYYFSQNSYLTAAGANCAVATRAIAASALGAHIAGNCSGDYNQGSFLVDYAFTKHFDVYAGLTFTDQTGGLNSGYLNDNTVAFASGVRIKW